MSWRFTRACLLQALDDRPDHRPRSCFAVNGGHGLVKLTLHFSTEADMVDWARGHCFAQWTGGLGR